MTDDQPHDDPFGVALSVISAEDRRRFGEITEAVVQAADAAAETSGWAPRDPAETYRILARHYRAERDPLWPALSAAAARLSNRNNID